MYICTICLWLPLITSDFEFWVENSIYSMNYRLLNIYSSIFWSKYGLNLFLFHFDSLFSEFIYFILFHSILLFLHIDYLNALVGYLCVYKEYWDMIWMGGIYLLLLA